jgi:ATP-binding cassette subfamily F protein 2
VHHAQAIANREVPIPDHLDMYHLHQEAEPSDRTALEAVIDHIREEMERLHAQVTAAATAA